MTATRRTILALGASMAMAWPLTALASDPIRIGLLATFEGAFTALGEDGQRGAMAALAEFGAEAGGRPIEVIVASSTGAPDSALLAARRLVEQDGVSILVGPLSGSEGLAVRDYAREHPAVAFINGSSGAQDTTLRNPADNFYRFSTEGVQWMAGLGTYAYEERGYRTVAILGEDYSFPYSQVMGFMLEFCEAGGRVPAKFWVPIGTNDYSSVIAALPEDVDAIFVSLGGADAVNFLTQYQQSGGVAPLLAGSTTVDQTVLSAEGRLRTGLIGVASASPVAGTNDAPEWLEFVEAYRQQPGALAAPSLFAHAYYIGMKAALLAVEETGGDFGENGENLHAALAGLEFVTPTGPVRLDHNRQAIADIFLTEIVEAEDGGLTSRIVRVTSGVNQTLGMDEAEFLAMGSPSRDNPSCE
ncbi:MAG: ABC transporter substrate-binding protein [Pararhodobacter sp.]